MKEGCGRVGGTSMSLPLLHVLCVLEPRDRDVKPCAQIVGRFKHVQPTVIGPDGHSVPHPTTLVAVDDLGTDHERPRRRARVVYGTRPAIQGPALPVVLPAQEVERSDWSDQGP